MACGGCRSWGGHVPSFNRGVNRTIVSNNSSEDVRREDNKIPVISLWDRLNNISKQKSKNGDTSK